MRRQTTSLDPEIGEVRRWWRQREAKRLASDRRATDPISRMLHEAPTNRVRVDVVPLLPVLMAGPDVSDVATTRQPDGPVVSMGGEEMRVAPSSVERESTLERGNRWHDPTIPIRRHEVHMLRHEHERMKFQISRTNECPEESGQMLARLHPCEEWFTTDAGERHEECLRTDVLAS